jgi:hypothetical protein
MIEAEETATDDAEPQFEHGRRVKSSSLLWFISSRPYVPMADIRRRFGLQTECGTFLFDEEGPVHVGLPQQAAETLLDLKRKQKVGLQYDLEYATRIVVGAFPIRIRLAPPVSFGRPSPPPGALEPPPALPEVFADETLPAEAPLPTPAFGAAEVAPQGRRRRRRR